MCNTKGAFTGVVVQARAVHATKRFDVVPKPVREFKFSDTQFCMNTLPKGINRSPWKNAILGLIVLSGSLFISGMIAEIFLRIAGYQGAPQSSIDNIYAVEDSILDWRYVPKSVLNIGRVVYAYNKAGFRDIDHEVTKPPAIKRVVVLGDSVTEGFGVEWQSVMSHILQSQLGSDFEVINIAAGGLNTPQEVHLLKQVGMQYQPDIVVLNFILNDGDFYTNFRGAEGYLAGKDSKIGILNLPIDPRFKRLLKSSALIYFIKERIENLKGRLLGLEQTDYFTVLWGKEENRKKVINGFKQLAALQKEGRFRVVVIIWPLITEYRDYPFESVHNWVEEQAQKNGFSTIDLLPSFSSIPYRDLQVTSEDNVHANAVGHKMAAEAFLTWYRSNEP